jgi:hypothetical protein
MNLESKKRRGDESGKQERMNFSDLFHGFVISRFVLSSCFPDFHVRTG